MLVGTWAVVNPLLFAVKFCSLEYERMISLDGLVCEISETTQFVIDDPDAEMIDARMSRYAYETVVSQPITRDPEQFVPVTKRFVSRVDTRF